MNLLSFLQAAPGVPPTPEGVTVPETPHPIDSAELAAAIDHIREGISVGMGQFSAQLAAALAPGQSVVPLGSESVEFATHRVMEGQSSQVLGSDETRVEATFIALESGVMLFNERGKTPVSIEDYGGLVLPVNVPIELDTRAAVFAAAVPGSGDARLGVISQSANFYITPSS